MAGQVDGSIIVDTQLDAEGFKAGSAELNGAIKSLNKEMSNLGPMFEEAMSGSWDAVSSFETETENLENTISELESKLQDLGGAHIPTKEYASVCAELDKICSKMDQLSAKQEKMLTLGVDKDSMAYKSLRYDLDKLEEKYYEVSRAKAEMAANGTSHIEGINTAEYAQLEAALLSARQQLAGMRSDVEEVNRELEQVTEHGNSIKSAFRGVAGLLGSIVKKAAKFVFTIGKFSVKSLVSGIKSAASSMAKLVKHGKSMNSQFSGLISGAKKFALSLLGAKGIYALLRKAVSAYMSENQQLSSTLNACWSGIGNILGPIIERVISLVSTAVAYVTKFLGLFGVVGKTTTGAINSAASAANSATEKLKRSLASFDELTVLNDKETESGSANGATSDATGSLPNVTLPDWVQSIADQLKSGNWAEAAAILTDKLNGMVDSVDWAGIGSKIGYFLNGALTFLATTITTFDWHNLGVSLGELINNIIYGVDWANLGIVLGWKFIALIEGLGGLFATIDWDALGAALGDAFMGLWDAIDWAQAGRTLSNGIIGVCNGLSSAIKKVDWQKIGKNVATFIANIDWSGVFTALSNGLGAALGGLAAFLWGLIEDAWGSVVDWWYETAYEDGEFTIEGLLKGIGECISNIGTWINDNIFQPFIEGFKSAFGIHSPSTVMEEQGGYIIGGLLEGLQNSWTEVKDWISESFDNLMTTVSDWATNAGEKISSWATNAKESIVSWASDTGTSIKEWATDAVSNVKSWATNTKERVSKWSSNVSSTISDWASGAAEKIKSWANSTSENVAAVTEDTESDISEWSGDTKSEVGTWKDIVGSYITSWVALTKSSISSWGTEVSSTFTDKVSAIKNTVSSGFSKARSYMVDNMRDAMHSITGLNWYGIGYNICAGIADGLSAGWSWLIDLVCKIVNSLYTAACKALGIHSPSKLFRDGVGKNIGLGVGEGIEASESSVLDSVIGVADAIADEFASNTYSIGGVISNTDVSNALSGFSDTITDSFSGLMDRLQAIADSVTFRIPAIATGSVIPSSVAAMSIEAGDAGASRHEELMSMIADLLGSDVASFEAILEKLDTILQAIDDIEIGDTTIGEANQRYKRRMNVIRGVNA